MATKNKLETSSADKSEILAKYGQKDADFSGKTEEELKKVKKFSFGGKIMNCFCKKVYDGDTVHLVFDIAGDYKYWSCRLYGYNSAEMNPKHEDEEKNRKEKESAIKARDYLAKLILNKFVVVQFIKSTDRYGRLLVNIYLVDDKSGNILFVNKMMIDNGHGAEYYGEGDKKY